jgi:hypothetical protein
MRTDESLFVATVITGLVVGVIVFMVFVTEGQVIRVTKDTVTFLGILFFWVFWLCRFGGYKK